MIMSPDSGASIVASRDKIYTMSRNIEELFREASDLPEADRAELAGLLLESLESEPDPGVEEAWAEEVERRVRQIETGEVRTIPWEEVRAKLHARLNEAR
jgi:putative addiction module component (TIGR02574 family)